MMELDKQFRESKRTWKKPSPEFANHEKRFDQPKSQAPDPGAYSPVVGTIGDSVTRQRKLKSSWAADASPQRPRVVELPCKGDYNPVDPKGQTFAATSAFASTTPKFEDHASSARSPSAAAQSNASSPVSTSRQRPSSGMASKSPRFSDPVVWTQASYECDVGTLGHDLAVAKKHSSPWSKDKNPQRPEPSHVVDKFYDAKIPSSAPVTARSSFKSSVPRFHEEKSDAPPVGAYTSPFISCGMMP